ncbi:MAG: chemotaxis protein CheD [Isosphaeraceae bacterium]
MRGSYSYERQRVGAGRTFCPTSRGSSTSPASTPTRQSPPVEDLEKHAGRRLRPRLQAKLFGGASMFQSSGPLEIGRMNREASERILAGLGIPVVARDMGATPAGRLTFDLQTGIVAVKIPGGKDYEL